MTIERIPTDAFERLDDESIRSRVWAVLIQKAITGAPHDASIRDFLYGAFTLIDERLVKTMAALHKAERDRDDYKNQAEYNERERQTYRMRVRALSDKVQRYCRKLVCCSFTHGQKNGAILMLAELVSGEGLDDTGTNDIPF